MPIEPRVQTPYPFSADAVNHETVNLTWTLDDASVSNIFVLRSLDGLYFETIASLPGTARSYSDTTLREETMYFYYVRAYRNIDADYADSEHLYTTTHTFVPPLGGGGGSNLKLWLKATSLNVAFNDGDRVDVWADDSGNNNFVFQNTVNNQPVFKEGTQGGSPSVYFNGSAWLEKPATIATNPDFTIIAVLKFDNVNAVAETVFRHGQLFGNGLMKSANGKREVLLRGIADCENGLVTTNPELWTATGRSGQSPAVLLAVNEAPRLLTPQDVAPVAGDVSTHVGTWDGGQFPFRGHLMELFYYDAVLNQAQVVDITRYLRRKYDV